MALKPELMVSSDPCVPPMEEREAPEGHPCKVDSVRSEEGFRQSDTMNSEKPKWAEVLAHTSSTSTMASTRSEKSLKRKLRREVAIDDFLEENHFAHMNAPQQSQACFPMPGFSRPEVLYPVHVAAQQGDHVMLRMLCSEGADLEQKTSKGRSTWDIAKEADRFGSHQQVLGLLDSKIVSLRAFRKMAEESSTPPNQAKLAKQACL